MAAHFLVSVPNAVITETWPGVRNGFKSALPLDPDPQIDRKSKV